MTAAVMQEMGFKIVDADESEPGPAQVAPEPTPAGVLPPIPLSPVGPDGLPAGMGAIPVGG